MRVRASTTRVKAAPEITTPSSFQASTPPRTTRVKAASVAIPSSTRIKYENQKEQSATTTMRVRASTTRVKAAPEITTPSSFQASTPPRTTRVKAASVAIPSSTRIKYENQKEQSATTTMRAKASVAIPSTTKYYKG